MDIQVFLIILILVMGYFLFKSMEQIKFLNLKVENLKNEHLIFKNEYTKRIKVVEKSSNDIYRTIPNVNSKIDYKVNTLINERKKEVEKYVLESFKKVGKDILFENKMDEHRTTYISLNDVLKNEKDKYSNYFNNVMSNVQMFKQDVQNSKNTIEKVNSDINKKLKQIEDISNEHKYQFNQGVQARLDIIKKIESIEKRLSELSKNGTDKISTNYGSSNSSDSDDGFRVENNLIKGMSDLINDGPHNRNHLKKNR